MKSLIRRVFCAECGAVRIRQACSPYAVCPNGHGRLVPRFTKAECQQAIAAVLSQARRVERNTFAIDGHDGLFCYRGGSGRRRVEPDAKVQTDELVARHVLRTPALVRVFARKA